MGSDQGPLVLFDVHWFIFNEKLRPAHYGHLPDATQFQTPPTSSPRAGGWLTTKNGSKDPRFTKDTKITKRITILLYILVMRFTSLPRIHSFAFIRIEQWPSGITSQYQGFWGYGLLPSPKAPDETCHSCHVQQATTKQPPYLLSLRIGSIMRWSSWRLNSANSKKSLNKSLNVHPIWTHGARAWSSIVWLYAQGMSS